MTKESKRFLHRVAKEIPLGGKRKRAFMNDLSASLAEYNIVHPRASQAELIGRFGEPAEIADRFYELMPYAELRRRVKRGKAVMLVAVCTAVLLVLSTWGLYTKLIYDNANAAVYYIDSYSSEYASVETKDDVRALYPELSEEQIELFFPELP